LSAPGPTLPKPKGRRAWNGFRIEQMALPVTELTASACNNLSSFETVQPQFSNEIP
jgi:hypothetical protein